MFPIFSQIVQTRQGSPRRRAIRRGIGAFSAMALACMATTAGAQELPDIGLPTPAPAQVAIRASIGTQYCDENVDRVLFESDFESGDFLVEGWEALGDVSIVPEASSQSDLGARLRPGGRIIWQSSTVGASRVQLSYVRRTRGMINNHYLWIEWWDGSSWRLVERHRRLGFERRSVELPADAGNNPAFKVRFRHKGAGHGGKADVDNVRITQLSAHIEAVGSLSVIDNDLTLIADGIPRPSVTLFLFGDSSAQIPMGNGIRCIGGSPVLHLGPPSFTTSGTVSRSVNLNAEPALSAITQMAPINIHFQLWHREQVGTSNFSDALSIQFVP